MNHKCPNCESLMGDGEACPECNHVDWDDFCECGYCIDKRCDAADALLGIEPDDDYEIL